MQLYLVSRRRAWHTAEELDASVGCAPSVIDLFAPDIRWIRSYVVREDDGTLSGFCLYQATGPDVIRAYSEAIDLPADAILPVTGSMVLAPDPERIAAP